MESSHLSFDIRSPSWKAMLREFLFVIAKSNATFFFFLPFSFNKHDQNIDMIEMMCMRGETFIFTLSSEKVRAAVLEI